MTATPKYFSSSRNVAFVTFAAATGFELAQFNGRDSFLTTLGLVFIVHVIGRLKLIYGKILFGDPFALG